MQLFKPSPDQMQGLPPMPDPYAQQQGQSYQPMSFSPGVNEYQFENYLRAVLGDDDFLGVVEHDLRGEEGVLQDDGRIEWKQKRDPLIRNPEAISKIMGILRTMGLNKVTRITILSEKQINEKMRVFECKLAELLAAKYVEWGIDKNEVSMLYNCLWNLVENALLIAKDGRLLVVLRSNYSENRMHDVQQQMNQPSRWGVVKNYMSRSPFS